MQQISKKVILASSNPGKVREFSQILGEMGFTVIPQSQLAIPAIEENALSFVENALLKARHAAEKSGLPAVADDSGLIVDALNGAPGMYSSRYAGEGATDSANLEKVLQEIRDIPPLKRTARFFCIIVYMSHHRDPIPIIREGVWEGRLTHAPVGQNGFGYDPIFFIPSLGRTSAQLTPEVKNSLSHRGQALRLLVEALRARGINNHPANEKHHGVI